MLMSASMHTLHNFSSSSSSPLFSSADETDGVEVEEEVILSLAVPPGEAGADVLPPG